MSTRAGFAYVAMLLLVSIVAVTALAFASRIGVESAGLTSRQENTQADYLARAAANHALYRLLHESSFPPYSDRYIMHDFGAGRYGYLVRRHTSTTYATVATVGIVGESVARRSYVICIQ